MVIDLKKEDVFKGNLILVNKECKVVKDENLKLVSFSQNFKDILLEKEANSKLIELLDKINSKTDIVPVSGYRTLKEQEEIYFNSLEENGKEFTEKFVALPNTSEHQTGLAIDLALNSQNIDFICPSFPYYGICQEFRKEAENYGFIERYQDNKKDITKIAKEEWHFRYTGYPHSKIINKYSFCLEEYIDFLKEYVYPDKPLEFENYKIYYVPIKGSRLLINFSDDCKFQLAISGNNCDGFILTEELL